MNQPSKRVSEVRNVSVSFAGMLDSGESLVGTPTIVEVTTTDLTLTNKVVSNKTMMINEVNVAAGEAVQFSVAGGSAGKHYRIFVSCDTDSVPAQTLGGEITLGVIAD